MSPRVLAALAFVLCAACQPNTFKVKRSGQTTVPGGGVLGGLLNSFAPVGSFQNIDFNNDQYFKNQGVTKDQVSSVKVSGLTMKIVSPASQDFSFLDELSFYASTNNSEAEIAFKHNIAAMGLPAPNPSFDMDLTGAELQPYVTAPSMDITVRGSGRQPAQDTVLEADIELTVAVKLF